jgi:hypothetical protein
LSKNTQISPKKKKRKRKEKKTLLEVPTDDLHFGGETKHPKNKQINK